MTREIKFRVWDKANNEMLSHEDIDKLDFDGILLWGELFQIKSSKILMQYTGLKDKNNKEIYEGDIVRYTYYRYRKPIEVITPVIWQYHGFYLENNQTKLIDSRALTLSRIIEVIGNIYETPNLIKELK